MPKTVIDYSNTIIYKITCNDTTIQDTYVGHTTNFVQRKHAHKQSCINTKTVNYKCKLYETIRNNGGWSNWKMEIINFFNCSNHYEARIKEQEYFVLLNANLNSIEPLPPPKPLPIKYEKPIICNNTNVIISATEKYCEICDYKCNKMSSWKQHIFTRKHIMATNDNQYMRLNTNVLECCCGKKYKDRTGLWRHTKKCVQYLETFKNNHQTIENTFVTTNPSDNSLIMELIKQNKEFKEMMIEQNKQILELMGIKNLAKEAVIDKNLGL